MGGVIYSDSATKRRASCGMQSGRTPDPFFPRCDWIHGGKSSEQSGIIRSGAKVVNPVSNSLCENRSWLVARVGAGLRALRKAYDPRFILAWPNARYL